MVSYYTEDTKFAFKEKRLTSRWLKFVAESETKRLGDISVIFCSDNYILDEFTQKICCCVTFVSPVMVTLPSL